MASSGAHRARRHPAGVAGNQSWSRVSAFHVLQPRDSCGQSGEAILSDLEGPHRNVSDGSVPMKPIVDGWA